MQNFGKHLLLLLLSVCEQKSVGNAYMFFNVCVRLLNLPGPSLLDPAALRVYVIKLFYVKTEI